MADALTIENAAVSLIKGVYSHPKSQSLFSLEGFNSIADDIAEAIASGASGDYVNRLCDDLNAQVEHLIADVYGCGRSGEAKDSALTFLGDVWLELQKPSLMKSYIKQKHNGGSLDFMSFMLAALRKSLFPKIRSEYSTGSSMNNEKEARLRKSIEKYCREQHFPEHIVDDIKVLNLMENEPYLQEIWEKIKAKEGAFKSLDFVKLPMNQLRLVVDNAIYTNSIDETDDDGNRLYDFPDTSEAFEEVVDRRDTFKTVISNLRQMRENKTLLMENPTPAKLETEKKYYDQFMVFLAKELIDEDDPDFTEFFLKTGWVGKSDSKFREQFKRAYNDCGSRDITYQELGDIFDVSMENYSNAVKKIRELLSERFN